MKVILSLPLTDGLWVEVDAEILFDLAPHLADVATFAVHPSADEFLRWNVSNVETGLWVMKGDSRESVIREAAQRLATKEPSDFAAAYKKAFAGIVQLRNGSA